MSRENGSSLPNVIRARNPDRTGQASHDALFQAFATGPLAKGTVVRHCCSNCMKDRSATGQDLQKCARCKMSWYCSRECQKEHWQIHKKKCEDVEGTGLSRLVRKLQSNKWLLFLLEVCVVCNSDLLRRKSDPDRPFMARINVGIEPTDISVCYQLFTGAEFEREMEGMLQLNAVTPLEDPGPLARHMMPLWNNFREVTNGLGFSSDAVGLLEFVNTSDHSITTSIHITQPALEYAQAAKPFRGHSALFGVSEVPFSAMSCLEQINSHIRSDSKNLLQLRVPMKIFDKEIIRDAGRGEDRKAAEMFRQKIAREGSYQLVKNGQRRRFTDV